MKKIVIAGMVALFAGTTAMADLSWGYTGTLTDFDATLQAGFLVQMYQDVNGDSDLASISEFSTAGLATGNGVADDLLLSITDVLSVGKGGTIWGSSVPTADWSSLLGDDVYSVIVYGTSFATAPKAVVVDAASTTLPGADPGDYTMGAVANGYVAIPEPATIGLMGIAGLGMFLARRKSRR